MMQREPVGSYFMTGINRRGILQIIKKAIWAPSAVFVLHVVVSRIFQLYSTYPHLDVPMHLLGGFAISYFFLVVFHELVDGGRVETPSRLLSKVLVFSLACTSAVFWEFMEFLSDKYLGTHAQKGLTDTLSDLLFGVLGSITFLLALSIRNMMVPPER